VAPQAAPEAAPEVVAEDYVTPAAAPVFET